MYPNSVAKPISKPNVNRKYSFYQLPHYLFAKGTWIIRLDIKPSVLINVCQCHFRENIRTCDKNNNTRVYVQKISKFKTRRKLSSYRFLNIFSIIFHYYTSPIHSVSCHTQVLFVMRKFVKRILSIHIGLWYWFSHRIWIHVAYK